MTNLVISVLGNFFKIKNKRKILSNFCKSCFHFFNFISFNAGKIKQELKKKKKIQNCL